jgi:cytochrome c553
MNTQTKLPSGSPPLFAIYPIFSKFVMALVVLLMGASLLATCAEAAEAKADLCFACHGAHGEGASSGVPRLAGQNSGYLANALIHFRSGARISPTMQAVAANLSDADIQALAQSFSERTAPIVDSETVIPPDLFRGGKQLAENGTGNVTACVSCHGPQGQGNGERFPRISGQPASYLATRLHEFQARGRGKSAVAGSMTAVASAMSEQEIQESAAYWSKTNP